MEQIAIYVLITVILIVTSIRRNKKQQQAKLEQLKKQQALNEQNQEVEGENLQDIFKKLSTQMFDEDFVQEPLIAKPETVSSSSNQPFLDYELKKALIKKSKTNKKYFTEKEDFSHAESDGAEYDEVIDSEGRSGFDLRQAVIYSEIINRKYE